MIILIKNLWLHISLKRRKQFLALLLLMISTSFFEVLSIGAVIPFLGVLTSPDLIFDHNMAQPFVQIIGATSADQLLLPITIVFILAIFLAGLLRMLLLWVTMRLSFATGADFSINIFRRTLYQPYKVHVARNSSEVINGITNKTNTVIFNIIIPSVLMINGLFLMTAILSILLFINIKMTLIAIAGFGFLYLIVIKTTRNMVSNNSEYIASGSTELIKSLQEGLGGIRDILIDGAQETYSKNYQASDIKLRRAMGNNQFIGESPRFAIEVLGVILIAGIAYSLTLQENGLSTAIPILGALALGAQRLLPVLHQEYAGWTAIKSGEASLRDALELLDQPLPDYAHHSQRELLPFNNDIKFENVAFSYDPKMPIVLNNINLLIKKGSQVGFLGSTGAGKSTLLDILMGLLVPTKGCLMVDDIEIAKENYRAWQGHIAHVPQFIFLSDCSIEENIAFGVKKNDIDHERIRGVVKQAQLVDVIDALPQKYQTIVGEQGVRLSGGQRQRIGIARALYKQADVIILDEATSALDAKTEVAVMKAIEETSDNLTILIIAHRISTLKNCSQIIELDGTSINIKDYKEISV